MANYSAKGIEKLQLSMQEFSEIPESVVQKMLISGGQVVVEAQKQKLRTFGLIRSGKLLNSLKVVPKSGTVKNGWTGYVLVYPTGTHGTYRRRTVSRKRSNTGRILTITGDTRKTTNSEVGFIQEFGAPKRGIKPKQWMRLANDESASAMVKAEFDVYDQWLKSKDL